MIVGIDATNLHSGGGNTHIVNIIKYFDISKHNIEKIVIWARQDVLDAFDNYCWLEKKTHPDINGGLYSRYKWLIFASKREFSVSCDILFSPSGLYFGSFKPLVSMSQNMLHFDKKERDRLGVKLKYKILLSKLFQVVSFKNALGIIFISDYAQNVISKALNLDNKKCTRIYHGISEQFKVVPNTRVRLDNQSPLDILYVSNLLPYKHTDTVIEAVSMLRNKGYQLKLNLVGWSDQSSIICLNKAINKYDSNGEFVIYHGNQPYELISEFYKEADLFVYASTCENMPNILIEAMSAGLPIACSNSNPMPEFLRDAGIYFNAEVASEIASALEQFLLSSQLCIDLGSKAYQYAQHYNWSSTSEATFNFIESIYMEFQSIKSSQVNL